jgi:hypothetical protein
LNSWTKGAALLPLKCSINNTAGVCQAVKASLDPLGRKIRHPGEIREPYRENGSGGYGFGSEEKTRCGDVGQNMAWRWIFGTCALLSREKHYYLRIDFINPAEQIKTACDFSYITYGMRRGSGSGFTFRCPTAGISSIRTGTWKK